MPIRKFRPEKALARPNSRSRSPAHRIRRALANRRGAVSHVFHRGTERDKRIESKLIRLSTPAIIAERNLLTGSTERVTDPCNRLSEGDQHFL